MKYEFPDTYGQSCILVAIDSSLLPMIAGALRPFEQRYTWVSDEDYEQGYNAFAELQASMANNCLQTLVESNNRIYRLLDTALNGTEYTASSDTPPVISPEISAVPANAVGEAPGLRKQLLDAQGLINAGWFGGGNPTTLADIYSALRVGSSEQANNIVGTLDELQAASSAAVVFGTVADLFTNIVETGGEGAVVATLIASTMGNAALMGAQAGQLDQLIAKLDRLITSLDGGGAEPPATNVVGDLVDIRTLLS